MKKILLYSLLLFWWGLIFPTTSCVADDDYTHYSFFINDNEIRFRFLDLFYLK